jgi:hypothetical protein
MALFEVTNPETNEVYQVEAPDDATNEELNTQFQKYLTSQAASTVTSTAPRIVTDPAELNQIALMEKQQRDARELQLSEQQAADKNKEMIETLMWASVPIVIAGIFFLLNKYLSRKKLMFTYSMFSLAGCLVAFLFFTFDLGQLLGWWLFFSLPLIIQLIYIKIFREQELRDELDT